MTNSMDERLPAADARDDALSEQIADVYASSFPYLDRREEISIAAGDLPHWHQDSKLQFVTFRLADSLPQSKIAELKQIMDQFTAKYPRPWDEGIQKDYWNKIGPVENRLLDRGYGSCILKDPRIRKIVSDAIFFHEGKSCHVVSFVIMPNHVHMLLQFTGDSTLMGVMHSIKSFTANKINKLLGRNGRVWKKEYFDRIIRSEAHLEYSLAYIRQNPKNLHAGEYLWYRSANWNY